MCLQRLSLHRRVRPVVVRDAVATLLVAPELTEAAIGAGDGLRVAAGLNADQTINEAVAQSSHHLRSAHAASSKRPAFTAQASQSHDGRQCHRQSAGRGGRLALLVQRRQPLAALQVCLLYTSDAADERSSV